MGAGQTKPLRAQQTLALTGTHTILAVVDDINRFPEINESNNRLERSLDFGTTFPRGLPDAVIADVRLGQGRFAPGDNITIADLSFDSFSGPSAADNLELATDNAGTVTDTDDKTITIGGLPRTRAASNKTLVLGERGIGTTIRTVR